MHPVFYSPVRCQPVAITVWVGFPVSIPTLRQSLFLCKPRSTETFGEAGVRLFPGSFSPEQKDNGEESNTERGCERAVAEIYMHTFTQEWNTITERHMKYLPSLFSSFPPVLFYFHSTASLYMWRAAFKHATDGKHGKEGTMINRQSKRGTCGLIINTRGRSTRQRWH